MDPIVLRVVSSFSKLRGLGFEFCFEFSETPTPAPAPPQARLTWPGPASARRKFSLAWTSVARASLAWAVPRLRPGLKCPGLARPGYAWRAQSSPGQSFQKLETKLKTGPGPGWPGLARPGQGAGGLSPARARVSKYWKLNSNFWGPSFGKLETKLQTRTRAWAGPAQLG